MDTYEKKFKEAIKKAKKDLEVCEQDCLVAKQIFRYFPELKVNEDELTWLTKYIKEEVYSLSMDIRDNEDRIKLKNLQRSLAWLEKQGNVARLWTIQDAKKGDILADKYGVYIYDQLDIFDESACVFICGYQYSDKKFEPESMICNKSDFYPATKEQRDLLFQKMKEAGYAFDFEKKELKKIEFSDVGHEYYSELLKNDKSDTIGDYAYQCVYCMSHDWALENPTWDDVQKACRLGAKWQKKHDVSEEWSEKDENTIKVLMNIIRKSEMIDSIIYTDSLKEKLYDWLKSLRPQNMWKVVDKGIYVKEPALAQKKDKSEPGHGFVVCYDHTLTPDVYERYIMLSDINCHSWWKPSDEQMRALEYIINNAHNTSYSCKIAKELLEQLRKLKGEEV